MARSYGSAASLLALKEVTYGTKPGGDWEKFSFVSSDLSAEQGLIASDLLGQGREPRAPFRDVINDAGNLVVPVEARDFGRWLQFLMGNPVTAGVAATGDITFTVNPSNGHTITLNGVVWTFVTGSPGATETQIQGSLSATLTELAGDLNGSANASITPATYGSTATKLTVTHDTLGAAGNAYTLASGNPNGVVSGATLSGGGYTHTYESGAASLPSFAAQIGHENIPAFFVHTGAVLNSMAFNFQRSGAANATLNIIAQGESTSRLRRKDLRFGKSSGAAAGNSGFTQTDRWPDSTCPPFSPSRRRWGTTCRPCCACLTAQNQDFAKR